MATWKTLMLQDSSSPLMEQLIFFHDYTLMIMLIITVLVSQTMISLIFNKLTYRLLLNNQLIEILWTTIPLLILIFIALPSLRLIYMMDELDNPSLTVKAIGHQWYWSYEYSDFKNLEFDSYMIPLNNLKSYSFRLLDVDNRLIIPLSIPVRVVVTASDVMHSWAIPCLGVKIDAIPGRLNQVTLISKRPGLFLGQCSEICGTNHSFMPIIVESITIKAFIEWINKSTD